MTPEDSSNSNANPDAASKVESNAAFYFKTALVGILLLIPVVTRHSFVDAAKVMFIYLCLALIAAGLFVLIFHKRLITELIIGEELALGIRDETVSHLHEIRAALVRTNAKLHRSEENGSGTDFGDLAKHALPLAMMLLKREANTFKILGQGLSLGRKLYSIFQNK